MPFLRSLSVILLMLLTTGFVCRSACGQDPTSAPAGDALTVDEQDRLRRPEYADQIAVDQKLGEQVPLDLRFHDERNNYVSLGDYFDGTRPVVLSFNYSNCPRLCSIQFNNFVSALRDLGIKPERDFQVVSISLDPREKPGIAAETKRKYLANYGDLSTADGWHFLVGNEPAIQEAAAACGIRYVYVPEQDFFSHPSAFIFCSPSGTIVRYLNGLDGSLATALKPAVIEASEGRVGSVIDRALYFSGCYVWDPTTGKYSAVAMRVMRWGGVAIVLVILALAVPFWFRRTKASPEPPGGTEVYSAN